MPENVPDNPFERPRKVEDPRASRLFAQREGSDFLLFDENKTNDRAKKSSRPTMSARREMRLKQSQMRRNILIGLSVVIGLILALIATDTLKLGTGPRPSLSKDSESFGALRRSSVTVAGEQVESIRELSNSDPLRVYIAGDSLVGSFGNTLATELGESGVIKATYDSRPSSGLVNTDFFNWNSHARDIISLYDPEVVIFMIGTNDASIVSSNPKGYIESYSEKVNNFLDIIDKDGRKVFFVLAPAMREKKLNTNVDKLNDVIFSVTQERKIPTIESGLTLSPTGLFTTTVKTGGKTVSVRSDDGVHITSQGGELLSIAIEIYLENSIRFSRFATNDVIKPSKVSGCCTLPRSSGKTQNSSTTIGTTDSTTTTTSTTTTSTSTTSITTPENPDPLPPEEVQDE